MSYALPPSIPMSSFARVGVLPFQLAKDVPLYRIFGQKLFSKNLILLNDNDFIV
jgi:hypothetical protein